MTLPRCRPTSFRGTESVRGSLPRHCTHPLPPVADGANYPADEAIRASGRAHSTSGSAAGLAPGIGARRMTRLESVTGARANTREVHRRRAIAPTWVDRSLSGHGVTTLKARWHVSSRTPKKRTTRKRSRSEPALFMARRACLIGGASESRIPSPEPRVPSPRLRQAALRPASARQALPLVPCP